MKLLVVDWDYFFMDPRCSTGRRETKEFMVDYWEKRKPELMEWFGRLPDTLDMEIGFWDRFTFSPAASGYYADSNRYAYREDWVDLVDEIWLFDAHHDGGYQGDVWEACFRGFFNCDDWLIGYPLAKVHMRYPKWREVIPENKEPAVKMDRQYDDGLKVPVVFDRVFVCRSSPWTPPWLDARFDAFVSACPVPLVCVEPLMNRQCVEVPS
ncbi:hypothetical protein [Alicyclobacillus shizuokensis]|uniref:hypothetical protein n=1 Tax=Alicyclobacillus shizuokensis TaxID=392014 RepID=UPI0009F977C7|nr:hypothetical protein [Alicyclobacillus shizuokensis]